MKRTNPPVHILGAGPAGLAAGYYARQAGFEPVLYEAGSSVGGNCRTLGLGPFRFDTGAHRFHDKDPESTSVVKRLLGDDLIRVQAPSQICSGDRWVDFPLDLTDLFRKLDTWTLAKMAWENLIPKRRGGAGSFAAMAVRHYGPTIAGMFLLNYSRKLWGVDPQRLSPLVAGGRLRELNLASVLRQTLGRGADARHLDGSFYYPRYGIGMISDGLARHLGPERILLKARVTRLIHHRRRIGRIVVNGDQPVEVGTVVSTLPLGLMAHILEPPAPPEVLKAAAGFHYRHLILCVFALDRPCFSANASLYFPDPQLPFTRLYEPKNRSPDMAPPGQTSVVLELPCAHGDAEWTMDDRTLQTLGWDTLTRVSDLNSAEVVGFQVCRIPFAYPVLEIGCERKVESLLQYFRTFANLHITGRSALFQYVHIHDLFKAGRKMAARLAAA